MTQLQNNGVHVTQLAKLHSVSRKLVDVWVAEAGLKPILSIPFARGEMRFYDTDEANALILSKKPKPKPAPPPAVALEATAPAGTTVDPDVFRASVDEITEKLDLLLDANKKLTEQNVVLLRTLASRMDVMQEAIVELATRPDGPPMVAAPLKPAAKRLPRVRILGLHDNKTDHIQRDFGRQLDMVFVNADKAAMAAGTPTASDATLVLVDFVNHRVTNSLESNGTPYTLVRGGLTSLRSALSDIVAERTVRHRCEGTSMPTTPKGQAPAAPPECKTEAERTAFAFGWFKALEQQREQATTSPQAAQPIACSYGDNGYACCEGGPCQADLHNDRLAPQAAQQAPAAPSPPSSGGASADVDRFTGMYWNPAPCAHCGKTEGEHFNARCHHIQGNTMYTSAPLPAPPTIEGESK